MEQIQFNINQFFEDPLLDCIGYQSSDIFHSESLEDEHAFKIEDFLDVRQAVEEAPKSRQRLQVKKKIRRKRQYQKERYYDKNVCRNIIRKSIRCLDLYRRQVSQICQYCDEQQFMLVLNNNMELLSGPSALKRFLEEQGIVAQAYKEYLKWFLRERYVREAIREGHMKDIKKYIQYKNSVLLPILE